MNDYHIVNLLIILLIHIGIVVRCSENVDQVQSMVLARIKKDGFSPDFIIDCGANVGKWTRSISKIFPDVSILMLEGNTRHRKILEHKLNLLKSNHARKYEQRTNEIASSGGGSGDKKKLKRAFYDVQFGILGDTDGRTITFIVRNESFGTTGDSIFRENSKSYSGNKKNRIKHITEQMKTIDTLFNNFLTNPNHNELNEIECINGLLKLDIQGGEMAALIGAKNILKQNIEVIVIELGVVNYNHGSPLIFEVMVILRRFGFILYDVTDVVRWNRGAIQIDAIFVKKNSKLFSKEIYGLPAPVSPPEQRYLKNIYTESLHDLYTQAKS